MQSGNNYLLSVGLYYVHGPCDARWVINITYDGIAKKIIYWLWHEARAILVHSAKDSTCDLRFNATCVWSSQAYCNADIADASF